MKRNKLLKVGLVGCGRIARKHAHALAVINGAKLAAVCDIDLHKAKALGTEFDVPYFTDMHKMMQATDLEMVSVLTESGNHAKNVVALANYGKHILVEKPMALTLHDADTMIGACDINRIKLYVVKQNRFNPPIVQLKKALDAGRFGKLVLGTVRLRWCRTQDYYDQDAWRGTWALDGGVLANQASHHIDLLEWIMGDVDTVYAISRTALVNIEAEDTAIVALKFRNGALGLIEATTATRPCNIEGSISILGEGGLAEIGGFAVNEIKHWKFENQLADDATIIEKNSTVPPDVYGFGHRAYYEHIVSCLDAQEAELNGHLVDGLEGRKSLELINAIYESIETRREIALRFTPKNCRLGL